MNKITELNDEQWKVFYQLLLLKDDCMWETCHRFLHHFGLYSQFLWAQAGENRQNEDRSEYPTTRGGVLFSGRLLTTHNLE